MVVVVVMMAVVMWGPPLLGQLVMVGGQEVKVRVWVRVWVRVSFVGV
jgi:hypothetical protein